MTVESGTLLPDVPSPLGWCSPCLAERGTERQAVTLVGGTSSCRECNARAGAEQDAQQQELAAMAAQAGQQLRGLLQPPSGGGRVGF